LEEEAIRLQARCLRNKVPLAVMLIDVDHFKQINDQYGHQAGDEVLKRLTAVVQMSIRVEDYFARYGGEEFCVLLPAATEQDVMVMAERLRQNYEATLIRLGDETVTSTISIGVADSTHTGMVFNFLVATADQAMYRAKETGRNRVVAYSTMVATT
jgi:diguanylate cyclase (GGDEF)-like protein